MQAPAAQPAGVLFSSSQAMPKRRKRRLLTDREMSDLVQFAAEIRAGTFASAGVQFAPLSNGGFKMTVPSKIIARLGSSGRAK